MTENGENETPPVKRRALTAIKRPLPLSAQKKQESTGKKRRAIAATPINIKQALDGGNTMRPDTASSNMVEGSITQPTVTEAASEETPSKMLRKLSRALVQSKQTQRKRNSTPRKPKTRHTPNTARFTPSSTRRSSKKPNIRNSEIKIRKKQTPQDLLRVLSRAPGFVQRPAEREIKEADAETHVPDQVEPQPKDGVSQQQESDENKENELDTEVQRRMILGDSDDEFSKVFGDQITETIEFTGEVADDIQEIIRIQSPENVFRKGVIDERDSPIVVSRRLSQTDAELAFWMGDSSEALKIPPGGAPSARGLEPFNRLLNELMKESLEGFQSPPPNKVASELFIRDPIQHEGDVELEYQSEYEFESDGEKKSELSEEYQSGSDNEKDSEQAHQAASDGDTSAEIEDKYENEIEKSDGGNESEREIEDLDGGNESEREIEDLDGGNESEQEIEELDGGNESEQEVEELEDGGNESKQEIEELEDGGSESEQEIEELEDGGNESEQEIEELEDGGNESEQEIEELEDGGSESEQGVEENFEFSDDNNYDYEGEVDFRSELDARIGGECEDNDGTAYQCVVDSECENATMSRLEIEAEVNGMHERSRKNPRPRCVTIAYL
ncbi:15840_t:CDS:2 [Acaulospora colombiana]|uniref:15840_t:CDS:1 n=1 Tax=Acaulospora colombiana TaxID=27376 RepID=A0ACA9KAX7_9GLOM|nr:15840_t:CDS:2 [Acaulospora colombiana]